VTLFVSFRAGVSGRGLGNAIYLENGAAGSYRLLAEREVSARTAGKQLLFATHGFATTFQGGVAQLAAFEAALGLPGSAVFIGVLWPGDAWIPYINYPVEYGDARRSGEKLAAACGSTMRGAASYSFLSHSLGGRLILEAVKRLHTKAATMCLMAAAVDRDVLTNQYKTALANCDRTFVLSSTKDLVLKLAYPAGDFFSDIFGDDDSPFRGALGLRGPRPAAGATVTPNAIDPGEAYGHMDYMPWSPKWPRVHAYVKSSFQGTPSLWP
jgi:hypothetical protein